MSNNLMITDPEKHIDYCLIIMYRLPSNYFLVSKKKSSMKTNG